LSNGGADLVDARRLLARRSTDLADQIGDALHRCHDLVHRLAGVGDECRGRCPTLCTLDPISTLISRAASAERCARVRTSPAKRPQIRAPLRRHGAASTAAFSARMLVWKAIPSITAMISAIFCDEPEMSPHGQ